jgi:alpha-galactosidase
MNDFTFPTLTNPDIIAINQDKLGKQCTVFSKEKEVEILVKPLSDRSWAVAFFNRGNTTLHSIKFNTTVLGIRGSTTIKDVWHKKTVKVQNGSFEAEIPSHGCEVFIVKQRL